MKKENVRKGVLIGIVVSLIVMVSFLGSYAYFIGGMTGNVNQTVEVETGKMELVFADGNNGFSKAMNFGDTAVKTFTIANTGTLDGLVNMNWHNLINDYTEGSLTYTLKVIDEENGNTTVVENKNVPVSAEKSDQLLAEDLIVPAGKTKTYELTMTLNYLELVDQTSDFDATLNTQFSVVEKSRN